MKSLRPLLMSLYADICMQAGAVPHPKDMEYVFRRLEHEGISFLTITLPKFGKALEKGLELGVLPLNDLRPFGLNSQSLPKFLSGLTRRIFSNSGQLLDVPCINSIYGIRQFTLFFKKVNLPCTLDREEQAFKKYVDTDRQVKLNRNLHPHDLKNLRDVFEVLFGTIISKVESDLLEEKIIPRHGPGATAERLSSNGRFSMPWHTVLNDSFPPDLFLSPNLGAYGDLEEHVYLDNNQRTYPRVVSVPKTLESPRLIAIEPACMQYCQQSLMVRLVDYIESSTLRNHVGFRDQNINGSLALTGSKFGDISTIDLSEASDRVSASLVSYLTKNHPIFRRALFSSRSPKVVLPSGLFSIRKFASMGSAMTFPIEGMVFYAISCLAACIGRYGQRQITKANILDVHHGIYVYGDDICVPTNDSISVMTALQHFGLKVNLQKSFIYGKFRESCGVDAYDGVNITPTYLRHPIWHDVQQDSNYISYVSTCNQLFANGMWKTSDVLRKYVENRKKCRLPNVIGGSSILGLVTPWRNSFDVHRMNVDLHRPEVKGLIPVTRKMQDPISGYKALMKYFLTPSMEFKRDYHKSVRRGDLKLIRRWSTPY